MSSKLAIVTATLLTVMIAVIGGTSFFTTNNATAQMTGNMAGDTMRQGGMMGDNEMVGLGMTDGRMMEMGSGMMVDNQTMTEGMMAQLTEADRNVTGSINLHSVISNAIQTQINTSLGQAASTAEGIAGNNSHAVAAHIGEVNGYLVYTVWVFGPDMNINRVIVDPAGGQVLSNMPISMQQMMGMGIGMMGSGMGPGMGMSSEMKDHGMGFMDHRMMR
jgi:hypothetical protein